MISALMPGPPFVFGAFLVILAILVAAFIPDTSSNIFSIDEDKKNRRPKVFRWTRLEKKEKYLR